MDNLEVLSIDSFSKAAGILDNVVTKLENLFPMDELDDYLLDKEKKPTKAKKTKEVSDKSRMWDYSTRKDEDDSGKEEEGIGSFFLNKVLFPKTPILYHAVMCLLIAAAAQCRVTIIWTFLAWLLMDGFELFRISQRMLFKYHYMENVFKPHQHCETVNWLNVTLKAVWERQLKGFVSVSIRRCLNELALRRFKNAHTYTRDCFLPDVVDFNVGDNAPWITAIDSYVAEVNPMGGGHDSITVDFGLYFTLKCNFKMTFFFNVFELGLGKIKFNVPFRITFLPLLRDESLFGEMHLSLLRSPNIDYHTYGLIGLISLPFVRRVTLATLRLVCTFIQYPQKIVIRNPMVEDSRAHILTPTPPMGVLRLNLVKGANMKLREKMDVKTACVSRADPYVIARLGALAEKTRVIRKQVDPVWNHLFEFPISEQDFHYREVKLSVLDFEWGFWAEDLPLGFTCISIKTMVNLRTCNKWYVLGEGGNGKIYIEAEFIPILKMLPMYMHLPVSLNQRKSQAILGLLIFEVKTNHLCKPMIVLEVSGRRAFTTSHGELSENWEFAEEFFMPVNDIKRDKLTLSLVDFNSRRSFRRSTQQFCQTFKKFIAESQDPQVVKAFNRRNHYLLGESALDIDKAFTGQRQKIHLRSDAGGNYKVIVIGRLYLLKHP